MSNLSRIVGKERILDQLMEAEDNARAIMERETATRAELIQAHDRLLASWSWAKDFKELAHREQTIAQLAGDMRRWIAVMKIFQD